MSTLPLSSLPASASDASSILPESECERRREKLRLAVVHGIRACHPRSSTRARNRFRGALCGYRLPGALDKTPSVTEREGKGGTRFSGWIVHLSASRGEGGGASD